MASFARLFNLNRLQQGNAGAWLALAQDQARRPNSALFTLPPILPSRYVHFWNGLEQSNHQIQFQELEKWYRNRHDTNNAPPSFTQKSRKPHSSSKHSHGTRGTSGRHRSTGVTASRRSSHSGLSYAEDSNYPEQTERSYFSDDDQDKTLPSVPAESFVHVEHHDAYPGRIPYVSDTDLNASRPDVTSPDPIPMPYRPRESTLSALHDQYVGYIPNPQAEIPIDVVPPSEPSLTMPEPDIPEAGPPMPVPETAPATLDRPQLVRKRSSLKRSNSRSSLKTVSWALNDTGKTRYATAVEEIIYAGMFCVITHVGPQS